MCLALNYVSGLIKWICIFQGDVLEKKLFSAKNFMFHKIQHLFLGFSITLVSKPNFNYQIKLIQTLLTLHKGFLFKYFGQMQIFIQKQYEYNISCKVSLILLGLCVYLFHWLARLLLNRWQKWQPCLANRRNLLRRMRLTLGSISRLANWCLLHSFV